MTTATTPICTSSPDRRCNFFAPLPAVTEVKRYGDKVFIKSGHYPDVPRIYMLEGGRLAGVPSPQGKLYPRLRELKDQGCETVLLFWSAV